MLDDSVILSETVQRSSRRIPRSERVLGARRSLRGSRGILRLRHLRKVSSLRMTDCADRGSSIKYRAGGGETSIEQQSPGAARPPGGFGCYVSPAPGSAHRGASEDPQLEPSVAEPGDHQPDEENHDQEDGADHSVIDESLAGLPSLVNGLDQARNQLVGAR